MAALDTSFSAKRRVLLARALRDAGLVPRYPGIPG